MKKLIVVLLLVVVLVFPVSVSCAPNDDKVVSIIQELSHINPKGNGFWLCYGSEWGGKRKWEANVRIKIQNGATLEFETSDPDLYEALRKLKEGTITVR